MTRNRTDDLSRTWIDVAIVVDPGPFFGVWMSLAIIGLWRSRRWTGGEAGA